LGYLRSSIRGLPDAFQYAVSHSEQLPLSPVAFVHSAAVGSFHSGRCSVSTSCRMDPVSTDASQARSMSTLKMNTFVILETKTQILSWHRPKVSVRKTSFQIGRASPDTVCNLRCWFRCFSSQPAVMSGLGSVHGHKARFITNQALGN
jgi:hypothetical protein